MARFEKSDLQSLFVAFVSDELADVWEWSNNEEYKSLVMEMNGAKMLYDRILSDMNKADEAKTDGE